jgi:hypothetical protein
VKTVTVIAHSFDCLPAHVQVSGRGSASTLRVAAARAMNNVFRSATLKRKHIGSFRVSVVISNGEVSK